MLRNLSLIVLLAWLHTGFQTSPILKAFLATFGFPFSYLEMVPYTHDPIGIYLQHMANFLKSFHLFKFTYFALNPNAMTITWLNAIYLGSLLMRSCQCLWFHLFNQSILVVGKIIYCNKNASFSLFFMLMLVSLQRLLILLLIYECAIYIGETRQNRKEENSNITV